jgi:hypothetical protein
VKLLEQIKQRRGREVVHPNTKEWHSLNEEHVLGPARNVNKADLRLHIVLEHGVSVSGCKTQADYGKLHLLIHAVLSHRELGVLMNLPETWGK